MLEKYERKLAQSRDRRDDPAYAASVEAVDQNAGQVVDALAEWDLSDDTLVLFTSDNGGTAQ